MDRVERLLDSPITGAAHMLSRYVRRAREGERDREHVDIDLAAGSTTGVHLHSLGFALFVQSKRVNQAFRQN